MVVVADTSPINYLVLIGQIDLLISAVHANSDSTCRSGRAEASARTETGSRLGLRYAEVAGSS